MNGKKYLQHLLNVRPAEWKAVTLLFWLQFFQGTGIAFFFTASFTGFLKKFPATELAWVMIISSPLMFATGWLVNRFEHKISLSRLGGATIVLMASSILLFQLSGFWLSQSWFYYAMFAWYYVLYLASNLCFWSIASTLYDVRQSKRLFAVISAGDIPAKFIGYTLAYFFVKTIGPLNMLWPAFFFMLGSLPFLYQISKAGILHHPHRRHKENAVEYFSGRGFRAFIKRYTLNTLIRRTAILTFLISCCLAIINYAFYTEVKEGSHDDKSLSNFIILFMACSQLVALLLKLLFTGRIVSSMGIKKSLMITPLVLLTLLLAIIFGEYIAGENKIIFYAFGAAAILVEVLRTAINNPVFLTIMQPLSLGERSKAHSIVKGIMDPFAFLFSGLLLAGFAYFQNGQGLVTLCYVLLLFSVCWIIGIVLVNKSYRYMLLKAISSRYFSQEDFRLSDEEIRKQIEKKIETGNELEVINILQMLNTQLSDESKELIFRLLDHPSDNVKTETILLIKTRKLKGAEEKLYHLASHSNNKTVQFHAVEALCREEHKHQYQKHFSHHHDKDVRTAALSGMLMCPEEKIKTQAEKIITGLVHSGDKHDKRLALHVLAAVKDHYCHPDHAQFFNESDEIRKAALKAIGKASPVGLLRVMMLHLKEHPALVMDGLHAAGDNAIPLVESFIEQNRNTIYLKEKLINLLGKMSGANAQEVLLRLLERHPAEAAPVAKALYRSRYVCSPVIQKKMEAFASEYLIYGIELLYMQKLIGPRQDEYLILFNSLNIELLEIRNVLLCLFGCMYGHDRTFRIRQELDMKKKERIANAMEVIEMTVRKELAIPFNTLYEPGDTEQRFATLKNLLPPSAVHHADEILSHILQEKPIPYMAWTKACSLYISKKTGKHLLPELVKKFIHSENELLKETAIYTT
jgi:ATP/ADP translocase